MYRVTSFFARWGIVSITALLLSCMFAVGSANAQDDTQKAAAATKKPPPEPAGFEYAFTVGQSSGPFGTDSDVYVGGTLSVPIFGHDPFFGQALLGEIFLGYSKTEDNGAFASPTVPGVPVVAPDLPTASPAAQKFELTTLQVAPGVRYKFTFLPELFNFLEVQPYVAAGVTFNVYLSRTKDTGDAQGDRAGGIIGVSPQLRDRGVPAGQGDVLFGALYGGGVDFVLFKNLLVGVDVRRNELNDKGASFTSILGKVGFRF